MKIVLITGVVALQLVMAPAVFADDKNDYVEKLAVSETGLLSLSSDSEVFIAKGILTNNGDKDVANVKVAVTFLSHTGKAMTTRLFDLKKEAVLNEEFAPFKPGQTRTFGMALRNPPEKWKEKIEIKVVGVEF